MLQLDKMHELVLQENIGSCRLSTIFGDYGCETAIKPDDDEWVIVEEDYPSQAAARAGHARWVELVRCGHGA
jgi:hypothetical protein